MTPELAEARFSSCCICEDVTEAVVHFLSVYQRELVTSSEARRALAEEGGFCERHTWQYDALAGSRGTCIAMSEVLTRLAERIQAGAALPSRENCSVCRVRQQCERRVIHDAARKAHKDATMKVYCVTHFCGILRAIPEPSVARQLVETMAKAIAQSAEDMRGFVLKFDARKRELMNEEERSADRRGLALLVGSRGVNGISA